MNPIYNVNEEDNISFYCSTLTDSKGDRSFIYVLNMYDKYKDNTNNNVYIRIPLHLCVISRINDTDAFKMLLNEAYLIITSEYSFNAKKAELLNYFMFISSIVTPPRHSLLTLNLNYMNIDFYFHSKRELPSTLTDTNINILFSVLDVSKIIKLWICILQERQIIIYGSRPFLLHAVIDAITKLIFPFKYPYLIISCLPSNNLDLLDVPTIYIMGVLSSCISIQQLQEKFSETCIVDLETGRIVVKKVKRLPRDDEIFLKKRIQFAKNPELFKDVVGSCNSDDNVVDMNVTFSKNIQRIFFHLIKQTFKSYKEYIKVGVNKLDEKKYVKAMDEDKGEFWEKILKSAIVDLFINENDECSNRNHFDELCKCGTTTTTATRVKDVHSSFKIKLTCPTINKNKIINALNDLNITNADIDELIQALDAYHNEHCDSSFTEDDETSLHLTFNEHTNNTNNNVVDSEYPTLINSFKDTNFVNTIPNKQVHVDDKDIFYFYDEEKGFINFINKYVSLLSQSKLQLIDIFFQNDFIKELYEQSLMFLDTLSLSGNAEITEEKENDNNNNNEDTFIPSEQRHRPFKSNRKLSSVYTKKSFATISPIKHNISLANFTSPLLRKDMFHLIKLTNTLNNKMQKLLFYTFYLEEIYFNNENNNNDNTINTKYTFLPDKKAFLDHIINIYHKAIIYDKIDFPYERYTFILSKLSTDKLNTLNSNINPIPLELKSYYNEALENSFAKLRVNLHPKMHFHKEQESLSPVKKRSCFIKSKSPNVVFEGGSNKLVDFARAAIQLKKDLKKEAQTLKKNRSKQDLLLNSTSSSGMRSSGGTTPFDLDKYIDSPKKTSEFSFITTINNSPNTQQQQQPQSSYRFGVATNFTKQIVLNQHKMKYKPLNPLSLIIEIGNTIVSLIDTLKQNKIALYKVNELIEYKSTLDKIKKLIDTLQFMNLTKFTKAREKYCFWLNAFNFLVIYAIIYSGFQPQTFEQWDNMLFNCKFDIGRYKYSLYEIVVCFLKCYNFHQSEIVVDLFLQKFLINEDNVLINFCVYLPIKEDFFELKVYKEEIFEEQTFQTALVFFKNNLKYDDELEEMVVSRYLERVFPMILEEEYKTFKLYIDKAVYERLENKHYQSWRLREINWDVIDYTEE